MTNCIKISKSRSKKQPLKVSIIASNGELLEGSETLTTRENVEKHILSMMIVFNSPWVNVEDASSADVKHFIMYPDESI